MTAVIIAGGRDVTDDVADVLVRKACRAYRDAGRLIATVISGACPTGVDAAGERWASARSVPLTRYPADWQAHGRKAGPLRNQQMADSLPSDGGLIAIRGGRGTADMVRRARAKGVYVMEVER